MPVAKSNAAASSSSSWCCTRIEFLLSVKERRKPPKPVSRRGLAPGYSWPRVWASLAAFGGRCGGCRTAGALLGARRGYPLPVTHFSNFSNGYLLELAKTFRHQGGASRYFARESKH